MTTQRELLIEALSRRIEKAHAEMDDAWRMAVELDDAKDDRKSEDENDVLRRL